MRTCPCKNCTPPKRHIKCHSTCQDYISWTSEFQEAKEKDHKVIIDKKEERRSLYSLMTWPKKSWRKF